MRMARDRPRQASAVDEAGVVELVGEIGFAVCEQARMPRLAAQPLPEAVVDAAKLAPLPVHLEWPETMGEAPAPTP
jgi:hypothetical protein